MMALCLLLGGSLSGGALIGTVPLRVALLGAAAAALLPRPVRAFFSAVRGRSRRVRLRIVLDDRTLELTALADSGNLLTEPLSGKPGRHRIARAHAADGARPARALCGAVRRRHALRGAAAPCAGVLRRLARRGRARCAGRRAGVRRTGHHRQRAAAEGKER